MNLKENPYFSDYTKVLDWQTDEQCLPPGHAAWITNQDHNQRIKYGITEFE